MAAIFEENKFFWELQIVDCSDTLWVENFDEIALSRRIKEISKFVFLHFWQKFENSKWSPFLKRVNFFENCKEQFAKIPFGSKISTKSLYLARLRR